MSPINFDRRRQFGLAWLVLSACCSLSILTSCCSAQDKTQPSESGSVPKRLAESATQVESLVKNDWVKEWLRHGEKLPQVEPFTVEVNGRVTSVDEELFYVGRFGSPLAYARALGWDQGANAMNIAQDLFAWYSIMRRKD